MSMGPEAAAFSRALNNRHGLRRPLVRRGVVAERRPHGVLGRQHIAALYTIILTTSL